jgi:hypothetical protein
MTGPEMIQVLRHYEAEAEFWNWIYEKQLKGDPDAGLLWYCRGEPDPRETGRRRAAYIRGELEAHGYHPPPHGGPSPSGPSRGSNVIDFTEWRDKAG